jgi:hypothetical protein
MKRLAILPACLTLAASLLHLASPTRTLADEGNTNSFIRFTSTNATTGRVETAVQSYRNSQGIEVTLFGAVHIADAAYYQELEKLFATQDVLLYEMIRDSGPNQPPPESDNSHPISQMQIGMKNLLKLEFQLDAINYSAKNFVHADLDPDTFYRLQFERDESLLGLMVKLMLQEQSRINTGEATPVSSLGLLLALMNPDRAYALKMMMGSQMDQMERMLAGIDDQNPDSQGSVIVSARNEHAMKVLDQQIQKGHRKLGIFYGAGHMNDFDQRLEKLGFKSTSKKWLTAWDIHPENPTPPQR